MFFTKQSAESKFSTLRKDAFCQCLSKECNQLMTYNRLLSAKQLPESSMPGYSAM